MCLVGQVQRCYGYTQKIVPEIVQHVAVKSLVQKQLHPKVHGLIIISL